MIRGETQLTCDSLTPEIKLHLITSSCRLWHSTMDACPFLDPYWAFYWPGGQALTRYIFSEYLRGPHYSLTKIDNSADKSGVFHYDTISQIQGQRHFSKCHLNEMWKKRVFRFCLNETAKFAFVTLSSSVFHESSCHEKLNFWTCFISRPYIIALSFGTPSWIKGLNG